MFKLALLLKHAEREFPERDAVALGDEHLSYATEGVGLEKSMRDVAGYAYIIDGSNGRLFAAASTRPREIQGVLVAHFSRESPAELGVREETIPRGDANVHYLKVPGQESVKIDQLPGARRTRRQIPTIRVVEFRDMLAVAATGKTFSAN